MLDASRSYDPVPESDTALTFSWSCTAVHAATHAAAECALLDAADRTSSSVTVSTSDLFPHFACHFALSVVDAQRAERNESDTAMLQSYLDAAYTWTWSLFVEFESVTRALLDRFKAAQWSLVGVVAFQMAKSFGESASDACFRSLAAHLVSVVTAASELNFAFSIAFEAVIKGYEALATPLMDDLSMENVWSLSAVLLQGISGVTAVKCPPANDDERRWRAGRARRCVVEICRLCAEQRK